MDGWMDGWTDGDQKCPLIFFIFKYINKQTVLIPNMVSKVVYDYFIRRYTFEILKLKTEYPLRKWKK